MDYDQRIRWVRLAYAQGSMWPVNSSTAGEEKPTHGTRRHGLGTLDRNSDFTFLIPQQLALRYCTYLITERPRGQYRNEGLSLQSGLLFFSWHSPLRLGHAREAVLPGLLIEIAATLPSPIFFGRILFSRLITSTCLGSWGHEV